MYGLAVNLIVSVSGHPWIIDEMIRLQIETLLYTIIKLRILFPVNMSG